MWKGEEGGEGDDVENSLCVDEETFCLWLDSMELRLGYAVQRWWARAASREENDVDGV